MNIFGIGLPEMAVIFAVALLVFGPKKLPEISKSMGKALRSFQDASKDFENQFKAEAEQIEQAVKLPISAQSVPNPVTTNPALSPNIDPPTNSSTNNGASSPTSDTTSDTNGSAIAILPDPETSSEVHSETSSENISEVIHANSEPDSNPDHHQKCV